MKKLLLPFLLFLLGVVLASWVTAFVTQLLLGLSGVLALAGLVILLGWQPYRGALLSADTQTFPQLAVYQRLPFWKHAICLFVVQGAFFILSLIFFETLESLTRTNPRLQPLEVGSFLQLTPYQQCVVHYVPWILYAVVGVGMAYFTIHSGCPPILADMIVPDSSQPPKLLLLRNYLWIVTEAVRCGSLMGVMALAILWQCQALNSFFQLQPLAETPFRTVFILLLIFLVFKKSRKKALDFLQARKVPLGGMIVFFVSISTLFIFWLHSTGTWFSLGVEVTDSQQVMKNVLAGSFNQEAQENRWCLLMWGWWGIWLPWMSSMIARFSMGRLLRQALLSALIFPLIFFTLLFNLHSEQWRVLHEILQEPRAAASVAGFLLLFILGFFGHVKLIKDVNRGGLLHFGKWRGLLLSKWLTALLTVTACYLPGLFMLGWLPAQVLNTLGGIFITTVIAGFIWALFSSKALPLAAAKYKVLGSP